ncbi:MAG TPA: holo-ACP synthase [Anaerolineales bacterium]|nr:holo-ACP synthase [Anaerolineales bacterium]
MNMLRTGVDLIEIYRLESALERAGQTFMDRVFTQKEQELFGKNLASLAARFAGKEAVSKAIGTGFGDIAWTDVEILRGERGEPLLHIRGKAAEAAAQLGILRWSISLSHTHDHAIAMVVAECAD